MPLPVSSLIGVSVTLSAAAAQAAAQTTCLILGSSPVIDVVSRMRTFSSLTDVAAAFGNAGIEYLAASKWFSQTPQPTSINIGRWAKTATAGQLMGKILSGSALLLPTWQAVTTGAFQISIDGGAAQSVTGVNLAAVTTFAGIAAALTAKLTGATVTWDAINSRFVVSSSTTGATSQVSFATAGASGVDISSMLGWRSTDSGAYVANGIVAESAVAAVTIFDTLFASKWYGLIVSEAVDADHSAIAAYIEAASNKHLYGVTTQDTAALSSVSTADIASVLKTAGYNRTVVQYSSESPCAVASLLARMLTTDWTANNSAITLMYKNVPSLSGELLTSSQAATLKAKSCNVFAVYDNSTAIIQFGTVASGHYVDEIVGTDWLASYIQTSVFNLLRTGTTKVPQTDAGNHLIATVIEAACAKAVADGLLGPGTWNSSGFGDLNSGDWLSKGYYVYQPPITSQSAADRAARKSVPFQIAAKLSGAVHTADIAVTVNQ